MKRLVANFFCEERGQDLIEYTLLLAFVCLVAAVLFIGVGQQISTIWKYTNQALSSAAAAAATGS